MDFVTVRDFRMYPKKTWNKLESEGKLVVTNNGKPFALMLQIDGNTLEDTIASIEQAEAMRLLNKIHLKSAENGVNTISEEEIDKEIAIAREEGIDNA